MASVSPSPRPVTAPVVRHGTLRCQIAIGGQVYQVIPKQVPADCSVSITSVTVLRKGDGTIYAVALSADEAHCTCPDHTRGNVCKHIGALRALGHIFAPAAALAVPIAAPPSRPAPPILEEGWQPGGAYPRTEAEIMASLPVATPESHQRRSRAIARREDAKHHARPRRRKAV
jgi:hypothetical protein